MNEPSPVAQNSVAKDGRFGREMVSYGSARKETLGHPSFYTSTRPIYSFPSINPDIPTAFDEVLTRILVDVETRNVENAHIPEMERSPFNFLVCGSAPGIERHVFGKVETIAPTTVQVSPQLALAFVSFDDPMVTAKI
ncbi:hypothetical protein BC938DRAFT_470918 [Jimgerdemannia flammicorona]|uniref:Uncharacterized protein n=1 Tax=Jimgerdemannia flammicorona TaxID=994334 RepID=A0A433Q961_9FUNG|nr:hypothetical protein BC938DRAFT_470918 [Jimgerdemannia flammicorona]